MNLLSEYRLRHNTNILPVTNESIIFFESHHTPTFVCLLSVPPRPISCCYRCGADDTVILETFRSDEEFGFNLVAHEHLKPDADLTIHFKKKGYELTPFAAETHKDIEVWLWTFFVSKSSLLRSTRWVKFSRERVPPKCPFLNGTEEMTWCAINARKSYQNFWRMFQTFMGGRRYLLFK